ncbi:hypothetical protein LQZ18_12575 [Lachnospiraceae bacterium ZAX-1]
MADNDKQHISNSIRMVYRRRLLPPLIYFIILALLTFPLSIPDILFPKEIANGSALKTMYENGDSYVRAVFHDLYFTGYTNTNFGITAGYYYYTLWEDHVVIVLLSTKTSESGLPLIEKATISGCILKEGQAFEQVLGQIASDLTWTMSGISGKVSPYFISEPAYKSIANLLLMAVYSLTGLYALLHLILYTIYILFPILSPPCQQLGRFGKPSKLLFLAEVELATLPQLATEDMFITEHFFIELASYGIAIVPIQEMLWIYKHSTLHKIFWYHFSISYTLHITANKHLHIDCPKNMKSDIDGIIDYLAEANHAILVGFSEDNRIKVRKLQNSSLKFEKLISFFKRKF